MAIITTPYIESCMKIAKGLNDIATKDGLSLAKVNEIYTQFNHTIYREDAAKARNTVRSNDDFGKYNPSIEEKALELTKRYFNIQKIRDLKYSKN